MSKFETVIIDYDAGNLRSVQRACAQVGIDAHITGEPDEVATARRVIFPGVGAAPGAMASLKANGLGATLREVIAAGTPTLGICLGLQISFRHSQEGDTPTLGLLDGHVQRFQFENPDLKVPHMGWNDVVPTQPHPLLNGIEPGDAFYFVHSYYPVPSRSENVYATADYEGEFACAVGQGNYFATQFHPEKSGRVGLRLLENFKTWDGSC